MGRPDDRFGLQHVERVPLPLQAGTRVYVEGTCGPTIRYGLQFMVEEVNEAAVFIEYSDWIADSYHRPQRVRVPRYLKPTHIPFKSTFDWQASERPPLAIALVDREPVQLLIGTVSSD